MNLSLNTRFSAYSNTRDLARTQANTFFTGQGVNGDVFQSKGLKESGQKNILFGSEPLVFSDYSGISILTDYGAGATDYRSNVQIENFIRDIIDYESKNTLNSSFQQKWNGLKTFEDFKNTVQTGELGTIRLDHGGSDIQLGNVDYGSLTLLSMLGKRAQNKSANHQKEVIVAVVDPGVGGEDRTVLVGKDFEIVGPNNGLLDLPYQWMQLNGQDPHLYKININKGENSLETLEKERLGPDYTIPSIYHGRDVFGAWAAYRVMNPQKAKRVLAEEVPLVPSKFSEFKADHLPKKGDKITVSALRDKTLGNIKLNLPLSDAAFKELLESGRWFEVKNPATDRKIVLPVKQIFSQVKVGDPLHYLGSTYSVEGNKRYLESALNQGNASEKLGIDDKGAVPLEIREVDKPTQTESKQKNESADKKQGLLQKLFGPLLDWLKKLLSFGKKD